MSEIHFVFEKPEKAERPEKKRSRLVTSCDACRTRKIKCRPSNSGDDVCEACKASGTRCVYEERDRIRAERGIASFTVTPSDEASSSNQSSSRASTSRASSSSPILSSYTLGPVKATLAAQDNSRVLPPPLSSGTPSSIKIHTESYQSDDFLPLFDPLRPNYPHPHLLPHFVDVFLAYAGGIFPFLDANDTTSSAHSGTLNPSIANAIAAYAARFSDKVPQHPDGRHHSGDPYLEAAKSFVELGETTNVERVYALILIAWTENGRGRANNFWTYGQAAALAASELGLGSERGIYLESSEKTRNHLRMAFWSVAWMELAAGSVVGKSPHFNLNDCSTSMPYPEIHSYGTLSRVAMYDALRAAFIAMKTLNQASNAGKPDNPSTFRDCSLRQLRRAVTAMRDAINPSLAFNRDNFAYAEVGHEGYILYLVHVLIHSMIVAVHCPSLFFSPQSSDGMVEYPRLDVAWSSAIAVIDIYLIIREINFRAPIALSSFFLPISIARGALKMAESNPRDVLEGLFMPVSQFEEINRVYLAHSVDLLFALSSYWKNMLEIKISAQPVALHGIQTITQPLKVHQVPTSSFHIEKLPVSHPPENFSQTPHKIYDFYHSNYPSSISMFDTDVWAMQPTFYKRLEIGTGRFENDKNVEQTSYIPHSSSSFALSSEEYIYSAQDHELPATYSDILHTPTTMHFSS